LPAANTERVRALELLARCPNGCAEALMLTRGFTVAFLAGLVGGRLVTAGLNASHVVWMQITDLGREALARQLRWATPADVQGNDLTVERHQAGCGSCPSSTDSSIIAW
jgi:hypothetical protein